MSLKGRSNIRELMKYQRDIPLELLTGALSKTKKGLTLGFRKLNLICFKWRKKALELVESSRRIQNECLRQLPIVANTVTACLVVLIGTLTGSPR